MTSRELIVLGSASQAPTRKRNHNGYLLRWDDRLILFDPGEGTQRQFTHAGVAAARITDICVTHFHGDHCLGLPGIIQRLSGDQVEREVPIYHPGDGAHFLERLQFASSYIPVTPFRAVPVSEDGPIGSVGDSTLIARELDHRITSYGYRVQEPDGRRFNAEALAALGISGPDVGVLQRQGTFDTGSRVVGIEEVSEVSVGQSMALVMDTRLCAGALALSDGVDLLVCESTFLEADADLAHRYGHLTALQAGKIAAEAGVRTLVLTHFSSRYDTDNGENPFVIEAKQVFDDVVAVKDFDRVPVPTRLRS